MSGLSLGSEYSDVFESSGASAKISVSTTPVVAKVGASNLVNRELLVIHNRTSKTLYRGYTSDVTTATGIPVDARSVVAIPVGQGISVYLVCATSETEVWVEELA